MFFRKTKNPFSEISGCDLKNFFCVRTVFLKKVNGIFESDFLRLNLIVQAKIKLHFLWNFYRLFL